MRRILLRSLMPFGGINNVSDIVINDRVGDNVGNLIFQNSVARAIMTEDTMITTIGTNHVFSKKEIDYFNSEYEAFIIPLANALRDDFESELLILTDLVKKLKIPCIVTGIGLQRPLNVIKWDYKINKVAIEFLKAVLEKSSIIGVRGELTAEYLKHLGFSAETDYTVIGCPSMYYYGDNLPKTKTVDLNPESRVAANYTMTMFPEIYRQALRFSDCTFVTQVIKEIANLYVGAPHPQVKNKSQFVQENYPMHLSDPRMVNRKVVGFVDQRSWIDYLASKDFVFGSRIHGNIINCLAGTPCYIFAQDERVKELADYHHIPHILMHEIKEETNIIDLYNKADFSCLHVGHKERVGHYLDFLDQNNIKRIDREVLNSREAPYDRFMTKQPIPGAVYAFSAVDSDEKLRRTVEYTQVLHEKVDRFRVWLHSSQKNHEDDVSRLTKKIDEQKQVIKKNKKELEDIKCRKSYKFQMKYDELRRKMRFR